MPEQAAQPLAGVLHPGELLERTLDVQDPPAPQRPRDELLPVGEVPVEAALRHAELARQRLDGDRRQAAALQGVQRRLLPALAIQARRHHGVHHTPPY
jgi:hypothetical protein